MNRTDHICMSSRELASIPDYSELVIVDWSSTKPILKSDLPDDPRIRLIRVNGETFWSSGRAFNFAVSMAKYPIVLKMDADVLLDPDFFSKNTFTPNYLYTTQEASWDSIPSGLAGLFLFDKIDFSKIGGFNEYMTGWGYEDVDFIERFIKNGFKPKLIDFSGTRALQHDNSVRGSGGTQSTPESELRLNMLINNRLNSVLCRLYPWSSESSASSYKEITDGHWVVEKVPESIPVNEKLYRKLLSECNKVYFLKEKGKIAGRLLHLLPYFLKKKYFRHDIQVTLKKNPYLTFL